MNAEHVKIIHTGNLLEVYEYEKSPFFHGRRHKKQKVSYNHSAEDALRAVRIVRHDNARRQKSNFRRLVLSNLGGAIPPAFFTFTFAEQVGIEEGYKKWTEFIVRLRQSEGKDFSYIVVPEFGTKNTQRLHFHALFWGLDKVKYLSERNTRYYADIWQNGFLDCIPTDGHEKLASYFAKYMSKTLSDNRLCNKPAYRASRNVLRPQLIQTPAQIAYLKEIIGFSLHELSTVEPLLEKYYHTEWLGKGRFRLFNIK